MIRKLLATTALTAIMTTGAFAQTSTTVNAGANAQGGTPIFGYSATVTTDANATNNQANVTAAGTGYVQPMAGQVLGSQLMGKPVYNSPAKDAKTIGNVNDLVMASDGRAEAVLIGVGGFLGIGEKQVAVDFRQLTWVNVDGEKRLVLNATEEQLKNAPAFDTAMLKANAQPQDANAQVQTNNTQAQTNTQVQPVAPAQPQADAQSNTSTQTQTTTAVPAQDNKANSNAANANAQAQTNANSNSAVAVTNQAQGLNQVDLATLTADTVLGARVHDGNNDDIGEVGDVLMSSKNKIEAYVVDVGGFLGLGEKPVAIDAKNVKIMSDANGNLIIFTPFTQDQLNNAPTFSKDAYKADPNKVILK